MRSQGCSRSLGGRGAPLGRPGGDKGCRGVSARLRTLDPALPAVARTRRGSLSAPAPPPGGVGSFPATPRASGFQGSPLTGAASASLAPFLAAFCGSAPRSFLGSLGNFAAGRRWISLGAHPREGGPQSERRVTGGECVCVSGRWSSPLTPRNAFTSGVWKERGSVSASCSLGRSEPGAAGGGEPRRDLEETPITCAGGRPRRPLLSKAGVGGPARTPPLQPALLVGKLHFAG